MFLAILVSYLVLIIFGPLKAYLQVLSYRPQNKASTQQNPVNNVWQKSERVQKAQHNCNGQICCGIGKNQSC
jgi:hypothetical protein